MTCNKQTRVTSVTVCNSKVGNAMRHQACHCQGRGNRGGGTGSWFSSLPVLLPQFRQWRLAFQLVQQIKKKLGGLFGGAHNVNRKRASHDMVCPVFFLFPTSRSTFRRQFTSQLPILCLPLQLLPFWQTGTHK